MVCLWLHNTFLSDDCVNVYCFWFQNTLICLDDDFVGVCSCLWLHNTFVVDDSVGVYDLFVTSQHISEWRLRRLRLHQLSTVYFVTLIPHITRWRLWSVYASSLSWLSPERQTKLLNVLWTENRWSLAERKPGWLNIHVTRIFSSFSLESQPRFHCYLNEMGWGLGYSKIRGLGGLGAGADAGLTCGRQLLGPGLFLDWRGLDCFCLLFSIIFFEPGLPFWLMTPNVSFSWWNLDRLLIDGAWCVSW